MSDHYLEVHTDHDFIERHVDLTNVEAERLRIKLAELKTREFITDFTVEPNATEFYTHGYEDTLEAIVDGLGLGDEAGDEQKDFRVTVVLTTGIGAKSAEDAAQQVQGLLPLTAEFGPQGAVLPFEVGTAVATEIDWEKEPRP